MARIEKNTRQDFDPRDIAGSVLGAMLMQALAEQEVDDPEQEDLVAPEETEIESEHLAVGDYVVATDGDEEPLYFGPDINIATGVATNFVGYTGGQAVVLQVVRLIEPEFNNGSTIKVTGIPA